VPPTPLSGGGIFYVCSRRYSSRSERPLHHSTRRLPAEMPALSVVAKFAATYSPRSPIPGDYKTLRRFWYQCGRHVDYFRIESGRPSYFEALNRVKQRATYRAHYSAGHPASPQASPATTYGAYGAHIPPDHLSLWIRRIWSTYFFNPCTSTRGATGRTHGCAYG
jgi:hypothetical protein